VIKQQDWSHKDLWRMSGKHFVVEVSRHEEPRTEEPYGCYDSEGPHRWCVYAYIHPKHPLFASFDGTEDMWQDAAASLPLHGGPSFLRIHTSHKTKEITSYQVGADYHHLHDDRFTRMATADEASEVFADARQLFNRLSAEVAVVEQQGAKQ